MKTCPKCNQVYTDETLNFCLEDGAWLIEQEGTEGPATAVMSGEDSTRRWVPAETARESSAEYLIRSVKRNKVIGAAIAVVIVASLVAIGFIVYKPRGADPVPRSLKLEKITSEGKSTTAAISPDGKYAVYNVDAGGSQSLWTKLIATQSPVQIIPPAENVEYDGIRFSPDGTFITFLKRDATTTLYTLYQMPFLGGPQKKLVSDVDGPAAYSPDGKQIAYVRGNFPEMGESSVLIANSDGSGERILAKRKRPETFPWWSDAAAPAWSPDGGSIACVIGGPATGSGPMAIVEINVSDGTFKTIGKHEWFELGHVAWLQDKTGLVVVAAEKTSDFYSKQIFFVSYPSDDVRRITSDFHNYLGISLSADGKTIAAVQSNRMSNIWVVPNADTARAEQVRNGGTNLDGIDGLSAAPDGRIVFYSKASGADDIWIMNADGSGATQLTRDARANYDPRVTPDGRYIIFVSEKAGSPNIWRMDLDGGNPKQLTSGNGEWNPAIMPDSKWVFYDSTASGAPAVWKMPVDGGDPVQVTKRFTEDCEISEDGKYLVCGFRKDNVASWEHAIFSIDGGEPLKVLDVPTGVRSIRWAPDGRSVHYDLTTKGVGNVWSLSIEGGQPKPITNFKNDHLFNFKWTPDGKGLIMARGTTISDVVLISDFK